MTIPAGLSPGPSMPLVREGIEAIVFRTVGDKVSLWEAPRPAELSRSPQASN